MLFLACTSVLASPSWIPYISPIFHKFCEMYLVLPTRVPVDNLSDPYSFDTDPDPLFGLNTDPDPIRIQGFED